MTQFSDIHAVIEQLQMGRLFVARPMIQAQCAAFIGAIALAWGVSRTFWKAAGVRAETWERAQKERARTLWTYGFSLLRHLTFPLLCFAFAEASFRLFQAQGWRNAFIAKLTGVLWLFLFYRLIIAVLYGLLGHDYMRRYQTRLLTPLFALFIARDALNYVMNLSIVTHVVVFRPFDHPITLGSLLLSLFTLYVLFFTSRAIQDMMQEIIVPRTDSDPNVIHAILTLSRYVAIIVGVVIIAASLGVNMAAVAFISGGLSVGIGFGLQQIISNFLSGMLLLFEQTLRPGDIIDVNGEMGVVESLNIRATTMRTPNNVKVIVPNQNLLASSVRTYTKRNRWVRIKIPVRVDNSYCPEEVRDALLKIAAQHEGIRKEPKPHVYFTDFGKDGAEKGLAFELAIWIDDPLKSGSIMSELRFMIWDGLKIGKDE